MKCKFFVYRHKFGTPDYMDVNITEDTCLSQEDAVSIASELNEIMKKNNLKCKYYVVMVCLYILITVI